MYPRFDQQEYNNTFYCCEKDHVFVVFTTCYCPMCDSIKSEREWMQHMENTEDKYEELYDNHLELVAKVTKHSPELLI